MYNSDLLKVIGFKPKENSHNIYFKKYEQANDYCIEVDVENKTINYGELITVCNEGYSNTDCLLECVNRLLDKGYPPQNLKLESAHISRGGGGSDMFFIYVNRDDGTGFLAIHFIKYWGDYEKGFHYSNKRLFGIFREFIYSIHKKYDVVMAYTSELQKDKIEYRNGIIKIKESYRKMPGCVIGFTDELIFFGEKSSETLKDKGIFEEGCIPYNLTE